MSDITFICIKFDMILKYFIFGRDFFSFLNGQDKGTQKILKAYNYFFLKKNEFYSPNKIVVLNLIAMVYIFREDQEF